MGDKIPAVRKLASEITVNPNTVAKAYAILEKSGIIVTRKGSGTHIVDSAVSHVDPIALNVITERLDNVIAQGINLGLTQQQMQTIMETHLVQF